MACLILSYGIKANCQFKESLISFNYLMNTANMDKNRSSSDIDFAINVPLKLGKIHFLNTLNYSIYNFDFKKTFYDYQAIENIYNISYGLSLLYPIYNDWKLKTNATLALSSNFKGSVNSDDLFLTGGITFEKQLINSIFEFGLGYYTFLGKPKILPTISYSSKINEMLTFKLGFPISNINYQFNDKSSITSELAFKGNYSNLSNLVVLDTYKSANKVEFNNTNLKIGYNYNMDSNWTISINAGGYLNSDYSLNNTNTNNEEGFDLFKSPFISTGVKFNIKNKNQ